MQRATFLYLADGRLFVHRDGEIREADASDRRWAPLVLDPDLSDMIDPLHGLELAPASEN